MVPIQYFLALLAVLVSLMGCTQKPPPGSRQTLTSNNTSGIVKSTPTPEPVQTLRKPIDVVVHPSTDPAPVGTILELSQPNGAREWKLVLKGDDADLLYQMMTIKAAEPDQNHRELEAMAKTGKHVDCYSFNKGTSQCEIFLDGATGELKVLNKKLSYWKAEKEWTESFTTDFLSFDVSNNSLKFSIKR
jgi:hypothetical protein